MKILLYPFVLIAFSCSSTKDQNPEKNNRSSFKVESKCPENVNCDFEILKGKGLNVMTDGIGMSYYELKDDPGKIVFKYQYRLKTDESLQDAGYLEEVLFEIEKDYSDFSFSGKDLQNTKAILNVMCFCRGKAGSYRIKEGLISKKGNNLLIKIPNLINDQKISEVKITL